MKILLADDNPSLRSALALMLETRLGACIAAEAARMETLLQHAADTQPDFILLDNELPGLPLTGRIEAIRRMAPQAHIILLSARPDLTPSPSEADRTEYFNTACPPEQLLSILQKGN